MEFLQFLLHNMSEDLCRNKLAFTSSSKKTSDPSPIGESLSSDMASLTLGESGGGRKKGKVGRLRATTNSARAASTSASASTSTSTSSSSTVSSCP